MDSLPDSGTRDRPAARRLVRLSNAYRRALALFLALIGPRVAYALLAGSARLLYRLLDPLRARSEAQCRAALGPRYSAPQIYRIARQAFVHRAWNLADLMLADWLIRPRTCRRCGARIPEPYLGLLQDARRRRQPVILLTAYYGPFDLLPLFLGYHGIPAGVVYRPHANPDFDAYRRAIRSRSGCEMIPENQAVSRLPQLLESGGMAAVLSDHHAARHGLPVTFLGLPTAASRSVGLLATHYQTVVAVAGIRRLPDPFHFEIVVSDLFDPRAWHDQDDPIRYVTERYLRALERIILADPAQYLWAHARWGPDPPGQPDGPPPPPTPAAQA